MGQRTFLTFIQDQLWKVVHMDLTGKTIVVGGANVGLGFEAAKHFASINSKTWFLHVVVRRGAKLQSKVSEHTTEWGFTVLRS
jgi:retinol dehydrogenase 12